MKKLVLITSLLLVVLAGCTSTSNKKEINYVESADIMEKMDNQESFFLIIGNTTCSACLAYKPTLEEIVANKEADLYYLEVDTENGKSETHKANVQKLFEEYLNSEINSTPTTIYVHEGKMDEYRSGIIKYTALVEWYESK